MGESNETRVIAVGHLIPEMGFSPIPFKEWLAQVLGEEVKTNFTFAAVPYYFLAR